MAPRPQPRRGQPRRREHLRQANSTERGRMASTFLHHHTIPAPAPAIIKTISGLTPTNSDGSRDPIKASTHVFAAVFPRSTALEHDCNHRGLDGAEYSFHLRQRTETHIRGGDQRHQNRGRNNKTRPATIRPLHPVGTPDKNAHFGRAWPRNQTSRATRSRSLPR